MMRDSKKVGVMLVGAAMLSLVATGPAAGLVPAESDLHLTKVANDPVGIVGQDVTYSITVRNDGPDQALNVLVTDILPAELEAQSISATGVATCTLAPTLGCTFPTLADTDSETVTLVATPLEAAPVTNTATATSDSVDAHLSDNTARSTVTVAPASCTQVGTDGPDRLQGTSGADVLCGMGGNDRLIGRGGADRLLGGSGRDAMRGGAKADSMSGANGSDRLWGAGGRDVLRGGGGRDLLRGGPARDRVYGQSGRDRCVDTAKDQATSC